MTQVTYTADGGHYRVGGVGFDPGDTKDVNTELASYLSDHPDFKVEDAADDEGGGVHEDAADDEETESDEEAADDVGVDEFDAGSFVDRTPMEDVVEDIRAGEADGHLDAVQAAASRVGVEDAVGERRAELEG